MLNSKNFYDNFFKFLVLIFWPIIWYKRVAISSHTIELLMIIAFGFLSTFYIISIVIYYIKNKSNINSIVILYRISLLLSFLFTLFSFLIFTTSIFWLCIKVIFILICLYISSIKLLKYKIDEGLVGILSSILLLAITLLY